MPKTAKTIQKNHAARKKSQDITKKRLADNAKLDAKKRLADIAKLAAKKRLADNVKLAAKKEKAKVRADLKAREVATLRSLNPVAKEINVRLASAMTMDGKAHDHRLAAAILLADVRATCSKNGIKFRSWAVDNVKQEYDTVRKLALIGETDNPAQALIDLRDGNRKANKELRDRTAAKKLTVSAQAEAKDRQTPFMRATESIEALDAKPAMNLIESVAQKQGMKLIDSDELHRLRKSQDTKPKAKASSYDEAWSMFDSLKASDQMKFVEAAAKIVGCTINRPDYGDVPENLQRNKGKTVKRGVVT